jgi:iron complex outermembrane receptor protein
VRRSSTIRLQKTLKGLPTLIEEATSTFLEQTHSLHQESALSTSRTVRRAVQMALAPTAFCLLGTTATFAQDAAGSQAEGSETVVITSQKQPYRGDTPLKELPQSVQVINADLLKEVGVTQLESALDLASGVVRQNSFGGLWDSFAIRGFAGDENVPSGYLVNGFNAGRGFSGRRDSSNIESIEVLKGPGSALYGRSEPGGTINLITKKPKFEREGGVELSAGRYNTYRVAADYTGPITDSIAFRINGAYDDADSFRDTVDSKRYTVSPSFLVRLGSSTTMPYELEIVDQEAPFDRGIVAVPTGVGTNATLGLVPVERFLGEPGDGPMKIKAAGHQFVFQHELSRNWSVLAGFGYRDSSFKGFSSDAELATARQTLFVSGSTVLSRQRRYRDYEAADLSGRVELTGRFATGTLEHHVLFGADTYDFRFDQVQNRFRPTLAAPYGIDIFNPVYGQPQPTPLPFTDTREKQWASGYYMQDQIDLTEKWKMLVGVRFDDFRQKLTNRRPGGVTTRQDDTAVSPRAGLVFQATPAASVYASFSKGFRPNSGANVNSEAFVPEKSRAYEVGTKLESAGGRLSATIAAYKSEKSNILTSDPINAGFSMAAGEAESKGLEIDASGAITDTLRMSFSYAYTDAEVTKAALDVNFGLALPPGSRLINIPKHSGTLLAMQDFRVADAVFSVGGSVNYVSSRLGETGVPTFELPSYTLVNLTGSYAPNDTLKFSLDVDNLFDKTYYPSSYARLWVGAGAPRNYTVRAEYKF